MAYTTIDDPSEYFHTRLYSGNNSGSGLAVTNDANSGNFQPDWVWIKRRDSSGSHGLHDSNRGSTKRLKSDSTEAEDTNSNILASFDSNGFTIGDNSGNYNASGTYVAWQWKANGGTTSSNSNGGITSTVQANTTAGFSIVTWTGNGSQTNIGHGLGTTPEMIWIKNRSDNENWWVGCSAAGTIGDGKHLFLNKTDALATNNTSFINADPTSTVFDVGGSSSADNMINGSSDNMLAYCFTSIKGYSKIGSYTGNGNADGPFVYTGFKPAWVLIKITNTTNNWILFDNKRSDVSGANVNGNMLRPNLADAELTDDDLDFTSNGFKFRRSTAGFNGDGNSYIYMAFAEHPFVSSKGVPVTAR